MPERVFVIGVGMTDFVKPSARPDWDYPDMAREAGTRQVEGAREALQHNLGLGGAAVVTLYRKDPA